MDNARPHSAAKTKEFLTQRGISVVQQSPYSPDLNLCDRFLFRAIKQDLKYEHFEDSEDLRVAIQRSIRLISETKLMEQLIKLRDHCKRVIEANGDYISAIH